MFTFAHAARLTAVSILAATSALAQADIYGVKLEANPGNPLSRIVEFHTLGSSFPEVQVTGPGGTVAIPISATRTTSPGTLHRVGVVGLRAETQYEFSVSALFLPSEGESGHATPAGVTEIFSEDFESGDIGAWSTLSSAIAVTDLTDPLPADYPPVVVVASEPDEMQPGYTLMPVHQGPNVLDLSARLHALDSAGNIVWAYDPQLPDQLDELTQLSNGNFVFLNVTGIYREIDFMGTTVVEFEDTQVGTPLLHHDVQELPNGNLVSFGLRIDTYLYPDFCANRPNQTKDYHLVSDTIIEFTRSGVPVREISVLPALSPYRVPNETKSAFCTPVYNPAFPAFPTTKDLTHANGLVFDETDGHFIVSMRNQNIIAKFHRVTGALIWVIGEDQASTDGDDEWPWLAQNGAFRPFSQQHGLELYADGHISFYDNANQKFITGEESRPLELFPEPALGRVTPIWTWQDPDYDPPLFSVLAGSAIRYDSGTVLVADSALLETPGEPLWIRIAEVRQSDNHKVFEVQIPQERGEENRDWIGYNASRIESLYPPVVFPE